MAFYAVVSVAVIGLYLAFLIPIWLRWRMGDSFQPGSWTLGAKYKWMNLVAIVEIAIISIYFVLPFVPAGNPLNDDFAWKFVNYAPILTLGSLIVLAVWWSVSAKQWFTGPKHTDRPGRHRGLRRLSGHRRRPARPGPPGRALGTLLADS